MARIVFWEKPGCRTNARQKRLLEASGHQVEPHDIRAERWTAEVLRPFFGRKPVAEWFNLASPRIKSGEIRPHLFTETGALAAMCADPLLIRRPLMAAEGRCVCGFDEVFIATWIGIDADELAGEGCSQGDGGKCNEG
jgi:nitrogenase-associated protein